MGVCCRGFDSHQNFKGSVAQLVEHRFNPIISPKGGQTAIVTYFKLGVFEWQDQSALIKVTVERGAGMKEIYKDYLFENAYSCQ